MKNFGLYIHWPFCVSKCPYCDFNSHLQTAIDEEQWTKSYMNELNRLHDLIGDRELKTIYFGGGTPSLMPVKIAQKIIATALSLWRHSDPEITLEANPQSVEVDKLSAFKDAGINRVSIGVQSLNEQDLQFFKRAHSVSEAIKAIEMAHKLFKRYSFDLIYARPQQTQQSWREELRLALSFAQDHISLYQLTIEPNTKFFTQFNRGDFSLPSEDLSTDLYLATVEELEKVGMYAYEISNFAKPGSESQHNLIYWRYEDYAGIGPGAHGRLTLDSKKYATQQYLTPKAWLQHTHMESGTEKILDVGHIDQIKEALMMGLRLAEGISKTSFVAQFGVTFESLFEEKIIQSLLQEKLLIIDSKSIKCSWDGRLKLNSLLQYLFNNIMPITNY